MAPRSWELIGLSLLAVLGLGLALDRGDLIFLARPALFGSLAARNRIPAIYAQREFVAAAPRVGRPLLQNDPNRTDHSASQSGDRACIRRLLCLVDVASTVS